MPVGPSGGVFAALPQKPLPAAQEDSGHRPHCLGEDESPTIHTSEELRWDYRVTIRYKNSTVATTANPDEEAFIKELWPDQETYKKEEQRRFEILLGHIDLPVTDITPEK